MARAWLTRSVLLAALGMNVLAVSACASNHRPEQAQAQARAHTELAARYFQVGQIAVAMQEAQTALASRADYVPAHTLLGLMNAELRQNEAAEQHFQQALSFSAAQHVSSTDVRNSYAWFLCQTERVQAGLDELSLVLRDPLYASLDKALVNAAVCSARLNRTEQAQAYINAAVDMHPEFALAGLYRGHIAVQAGQNKLARSDAQMARQRLGETAQTLWLQARIEHENGVKTNAAARLAQQFPTSMESDWLRNGQWQKF